MFALRPGTFTIGPSRNDSHVFSFTIIVDHHLNLSILDFWLFTGVQRFPVPIDCGSDCYCGPSCVINSEMRFSGLNAPVLILSVMVYNHIALINVTTITLQILDLAKRTEISEHHLLTVMANATTVTVTNVDEATTTQIEIPTTQSETLTTRPTTQSETSTIQIEIPTTQNETETPRGTVNSLIGGLLHVYPHNYYNELEI